MSEFTYQKKLLGGVPVKKKPVAFDGFKKSVLIQYFQGSQAMETDGDKMLLNLLPR